MLPRDSFRDPHAMNDAELEDLPATPAACLLAAIDAEQNELLLALDALNLQIEHVLKESGFVSESNRELLSIHKAA